MSAASVNFTLTFSSISYQGYNIGNNVKLHFSVQAFGEVYRCVWDGDDFSHGQTVMPNLVLATGAMPSAPGESFQALVGVLAVEEDERTPNDTRFSGTTLQARGISVGSQTTQHDMEITVKEDLGSELGGKMKMAAIFAITFTVELNAE